MKDTHKSFAENASGTADNQDGKIQQESDLNAHSAATDLKEEMDQAAIIDQSVSQKMMQSWTTQTTSKSANSDEDAPEEEPMPDADWDEDVKPVDDSEPESTSVNLVPNQASQADPHMDRIQERNEAVEEGHSPSTFFERTIPVEARRKTTPPENIAPVMLQVREPAIKLLNHRIHKICRNWYNSGTCRANDNCKLLHYGYEDTQRRDY